MFHTCLNVAIFKEIFSYLENMDYIHHNPYSNSFNMCKKGKSKARQVNIFTNLQSNVPKRNSRPHIQ